MTREAKRQDKRARQRRQTHREFKRNVAAKSVVEAGYVSRMHRWQSLPNKAALAGLMGIWPPAPGSTYLGFQGLSPWPE